MNLKSTALIAIILLVFATPILALQFSGGFGYLHTNSALLMPPGSLDISMYIRGYVDAVEDKKGNTAFISNGTSAATATFGYTRHTEFAITQILYQDLNITQKDEPVSVIIPGNTYMRFKFGNYSLGDSEFLRKSYWGIMPVLRYRVGKFNDVQYEPYYSNAIEIEVQGLLSYYEKPLYPDDGLSVHLNVGYVNHNDGTTEDEGNAQEVSFLASAFKPREKQFSYGVELYGSFFLARPSEQVLGREDWMYLTPFIQKTTKFNLKFILGLDLLLMGKEETSKPQWIKSKTKLDGYPNYPTWRLVSRISFTPSTTFFEVSKEGGVTSGRPKTTQLTTATPNSVMDRQALFKWALEERGGNVEAVDIDLEKIRQQRKKAEEELEQLKKELQEKQNK